MSRWIALVLVSASASLAVAQDFQASITKRVIKVSQERLVAMAGKDAKDPAKVFAIPVERFEALATTPDSGVTVTTTSFPMGGMRVRMDGIGPKKDMYLLIDYERAVTYLVKPEAKSYVELNPSLSDTASATPTAPPVLRALNKTAKVNGQNTSAYELKTKTETAQAWVSAENPDLAKFYKQARSALPKMRADGGNLKDLTAGLTSEHGVPVRVQLLDAAGYTIDELLSVEKKTFPPDTFKIPAGYQKVGAPG